MPGPHRAASYRTPAADRAGRSIAFDSADFSGGSCIHIRNREGETRSSLRMVEAEIERIDALARQGQSAAMQDWLREKRRKLVDEICAEVLKRIEPLGLSPTAPTPVGLNNNYVPNIGLN